MDKEVQENLINEIIEKYIPLYWEEISKKNEGILNVCEKYFGKSTEKSVFLSSEIIFQCLIECVSRLLSFFPIDKQRTAIDQICMCLNKNIDRFREAYLKFEFDALLKRGIEKE